MLGGKSGIGKQRNGYIRWKPILWYTKGVYTGGFVTDFCSPEPERKGKTLHIWEQSETGIRSIIEKFAKTGMVICDPMTGSSSVGVIALEMDCFFIGVDKDPVCIETSRSRLIDRISEISKKEKIA